MYGEKMLANGPLSRLEHLRQMHERHAVVHPDHTNLPLAKL